MEDDLKITELSFQVNGVGLTRNDAIENGFAKMREKLSKSELGYIVHAKPQNVVIIEEKVYETIEKFMFFFWPRKKYKYEVQLKIDVQCSFI